MLLSRTGKAALKEREWRHNRTKRTCDDVKVEPVGSMRRIAVLTGEIATAGFVCQLECNYNLFWS